MTEGQADPSDIQTFAAGDRVAVLLPRPLAGAYDYRVPDGLTLAPGDFVRVPLGPSAMTGVVWGPGTGEVDDARLKDVTATLDAPPMTSTAMRFVDWVAGYTLADRGSVLRLAVSVPEALDPPATQTAYAAATPPVDGLRMTPARARVLAAAADGPPRAVSYTHLTLPTIYSV